MHFLILLYLTYSDFPSVGNQTLYNRLGSPCFRFITKSLTGSGFSHWVYRLRTWKLHTNCNKHLTYGDQPADWEQQLILIVTFH
jgi:hypothetical protein